MTIAAKRNQRREAIINAARLGGAKGTLYNYFGNKEELFEALVRDFCARWADCMLGATLGGSPAESLTAFAEQYLTHLFSEQGVKLLRDVKGWRPISRPARPNG
ncbi:MAG: TetR/AcrR family transcriptional regulator [Steroidobacteraceae bacterium]